jgi:hypothetical protein
MGFELFENLLADTFFMSFIFIFGFILGSFLTSYSLTCKKRNTNNPKIKVKKIGAYLSVHDRFFSSISGKYMENNIN